MRFWSGAREKRGRGEGGEQGQLDDKDGREGEKQRRDGKYSLEVITALRKGFPRKRVKMPSVWWSSRLLDLVLSWRFRNFFFFLLLFRQVVPRKREFVVVGVSPPGEGETPVKRKEKAS